MGTPQLWVVPRNRYVSPRNCFGSLGAFFVFCGGIFLLFQKELTQREAAEILEVYTKTISKIKIRAINKLKKYLEEDL